MRADRVRSQRRATALHEAAHAVVGHFHGARVVALTLDRRRHDRGQCHSEWRIRRGHIDPIGVAISTMAGHEAEVRWCRRQITELPDDDYRMMRTLGCTDTSVTLAGWVARIAVRRMERPIKRVARALLAAPDLRLSRRAFLRALRPPRHRKRAA